MQTIALRDFQRSGASALRHPDEPAVLAGRGSEFVLFPIHDEERDELMRKLEDLRAVMLFHAERRKALASGSDAITDEEIDAEIKAYRRERREREAASKKKGGSQ